MLTVNQNRLVKINSLGRLCTSFIILIIIILSSACSATSSKDADRKLASKVPEHSILIPTYSTAIGSFSAGTTFVAEVEGLKKTCIITAHHVFGPLGGLPKEIEVYKLPYFIEKVKFKDAFNEEGVNVSVKAINIPEEKRGSQVFKTDLTVFEITSADQLKPLKLCYKLPQKGEKIWLATSLDEGAPKSQKLHEAVVISADNKEIIFEYIKKGIKLTGTSGSPMLNNRLEVVGVNLGWKVRSRNLGVANPSINVKNFFDELNKE